MNSESRKAINEIAEIIIDTLEVAVPITNLENMVKTLGGKIVKRDELKDGAEGKIYRDGEGFVIEIPKTYNTYRERFTIAHELGHLFLHMGYAINEEQWDRNKNNVYLRKEVGEMEYQAHEFAAALLMPRETFFEQMNENYNGDGTYLMNNVAAYFEVSLESAINRGRWLGILSWG
ncbi:ImmA/IrrE family metallo-endopeptidase [Clostridium septicum]|uniref:ImmA/IrrE family metallo-endopeptidase n=1 Tax=Clostridium septicum TaxID=1504 RepID=UPI00272ED1CA|nr:ImmA/IrrE family metallo-endopeptidase [Clostridium septicum]WLF70496.1 ImmA/IrrE family metallo-endopeptidase [Clostridium septicum]